MAIGEIVPKQQPENNYVRSQNPEKSWKSGLFSWLKWESIRYYTNQKVVKPAIKWTTRALEYIEKDDPETRNERIYFDQFEREFHVRTLVLEMAKREKMNRRKLITSLWDKKDESKLSPRELEILMKARTQIAKNN